MINTILNKLKIAAGVTGIIIVVVLLLCIAPWLLFWTIETLFGYHIEFTFWTWLAAIVGLSLIRGVK
jgi:hypothetical protein